MVWKLSQQKILLWWQIKFQQCLLRHSAPGHNAGEGLFWFATEHEHRWQCRSKIQHQQQRLNQCFCLHITTLLTHPRSPNSSSSGTHCINVNQPWTFTKWRILPPKTRIIYERLHSSFKWLWTCFRKWLLPLTHSLFWLVSVHWLRTKHPNYCQHFLVIRYGQDMK